ncbi:MAG: hypothetical protein NTW14_06175 [bacterium]|nr:hypothetical protein [bacterium]
MGRFTIILVVGFAIIAGGLKMTYGRWGRQANDLSSARSEELTTRNAVTSAVNLSLNQLARNFFWRDGFSNLCMGNGIANVTIEDRSTDTSLTLSQVRIRATATVAGETASAVVVMAKSAFSEFAYFTDTEPLIYFITGDTLKGPVHTNGQFHIMGNPVFYGLVSQTAATIAYNGTCHPEFKSGTSLNNPAITLPTDFSILDGMAASGGIVFHGESRLEFKSDATFDWQVIHPETTWVHGTPTVNIVVDSSGNTAINSINGVIASDNNKDIHVKGILDGEVTVLSDANIWIDDDITYEKSVLTDPTADDMLGLIAMKNIYVTDNAANRIDCIINATLMALNKSFAVQNYDQGTVRGRLTVVGGMVQKERGAVGTSRSGVIQTGYLKKYTYDERFLTKAPPNYPVYSANRIVSWYE